MTTVTDLEARRQEQRHRLADKRAAELKDALQQARTGTDSGQTNQPANKLLALFKRGNPRKNR